MKRKNLKYFALLVAIHTAVFAIYAVAMVLLGAEWIESIAILLSRYATAIGLACLVYIPWRKKCSPFVLPLSFLPLPVIFVLLLASVRLFYDVPSDPEGWEIIATFDTIFFVGPCAVLTLVSSIIVKVAAKAKKAGEAAS